MNSLNNRMVYIVWLLVALGQTGVLFGQSCQMWYEDNNMRQIGYLARDAIGKFYEPASWQKSCSQMKVYMIRLKALYLRKNHLNDTFIKNKMYALLQQNHIKLALDVRGATLTNWNASKRKEFKREINMIDRLFKMGVKIDFIYFQSALSKAKCGGQRFDVYDYSMKQRIADIVRYAKVVHQKYPAVLFGIIDALPVKGLPYQQPYAQLKLAMHKNGMALHSILLDGPYSRIKRKWRGFSWSKIRAIEQYVHNRLGIKFGKIITDNTGGFHSDRLFYENILKMARRIKKQNLHIDYCVLMSWFPHPQYTIPETKAYTMMYDFLKISKILTP